MNSNFIIVVTSLFVLFSAIETAMITYAILKRRDTILKRRKEADPTPIVPITHSVANNWTGWNEHDEDIDNDSTIDIFSTQQFVRANAEILYQDKSYLIDSDKYAIGRSPSCNLVIEDKSVSRHHCEIIYQDGEFFLHDLDSANGTYLEAENTRVVNSLRIKNGDVIKIGRVIMEFRRKNE